jgi:hypothetical protein
MSVASCCLPLLRQRTLHWETNCNLRQKAPTYEQQTDLLSSASYHGKSAASVDAFYWEQKNVRISQHNMGARAG